MTPSTNKGHTMIVRRFAVLLLLAATALVAPLDAQEESLPQTRQRLGWSIAQIENAIEALEAQRSHMLIAWGSINRMIEGDTLPTPPPPPADTTPPPPAGVLHFASEWERAGDGLSTAEQLAGTWGVETGRNVGPAAQVVDSDASLSGRGDYFRVNNSGTNSRQVQADQMVPAGATHWGRVYVRSNNLTSRHNHTIAIGSGSGHPIEFAIGFLGTPSGSLPFVTVSGNASGSYPGVRWWAEAMAPGAWHLVEWQVDYNDPSNPRRYQVRILVHEVDSNGVITVRDKWTAADFYESDQPGTGRTLNAQQFGISSGGSLDAARRYSFGNEGPLRGTTDSGSMDFASFAISLVGPLRDGSAN